MKPQAQQVKTPERPEVSVSPWTANGIEITIEAVRVLATNTGDGIEIIVQANGAKVTVQS